MMNSAYSEDALQYNHWLEASASNDLQLTLINKYQLQALNDFVKVDDPVTKQKVIAQSQSLVVNIAKRYSDQEMIFLDLIREGNQGLIQALDSYDLEDYFNFTAYAARCVRQRIECSIMNQFEPE